MRVLLINPATERFSRSVTCPLGLLSIATCLKNSGQEVMIYDRTVKHESIGITISLFKPDIAGISLVSVKSIRDALSCSQELKNVDIPVIWGGVLASSIPDIILKYPQVDYISIGEGEQTWVEIASICGDLSQIKTVPGVAWRDGDITVYSQKRPFIDLSVLPELDWTLINVPLYFQEYYGCNKMLYLYASKGCPGVCEFCYNATFHQSTHRCRPILHVIHDITYLHDNFGMDAVYFADELWCKSKNEMRELCTAIKASGTNIHWGCQTRVGIFDLDDYMYMRECGCRWIFFGIESGSNDVLWHMKKGLNTSTAVKNLEECKKAEIISVVSFIIGYPDETIAQLKETVELAKSIKATQWNFNFFMPTPSSSIYTELVSSGRFNGFKNLEELSSITPTTQIFNGLTNIPNKDLKTVRAYFMWKSFTAKDFPGMSQTHSFTLKIIRDAIKGLFGNGFISFVLNVINAATELFGVMFNLYFHPIIRKKYGLYNHNNLPR